MLWEAPLQTRIAQVCAERGDAPVLVRRIWMYWDKGVEQAPHLVRKCVRSIVDNNPTWDVAVLSNASLSQYLSPMEYLASVEMSVQARSDVIRIALLHKYGGVWADSTVFCSIPLDSWLPFLAGDAGFFAFRYKHWKRGQTDGTPVSSWFLYADNSSSFIHAWIQEIHRFWAQAALRGQKKKKIMIPYFWVHNCLARVLSLDRQLYKIYEENLVLESPLCHWFQAALIPRKGPNSVQKQRLQPGTVSCFDVTFSTPIAKLSWKPGTPIIPALFQCPMLCNDYNCTGVSRIDEMAEWDSSKTFTFSTTVDSHLESTTFL